MQPDGLHVVRNQQAVYNESRCILRTEMLDTAECLLHVYDTIARMTDRKSNLAGHWRFSKDFAEVQEGIKRLLAC